MGSDLICPHLQLTVLAEEDLNALIEEGKGDLGVNQFLEVNVPVWYRQDDRTAYIAEASLTGSARSLLEQPQEALVFLHGFNSDLGTCLGRMAQLLALGNMAHHIVPFVF